MWQYRAIFYSSHPDQHVVFETCFSPRRPVPWDGPDCRIGRVEVRIGEKRYSSDVSNLLARKGTSFAFYCPADP
jgi:hypothetical protein